MVRLGRNFSPPTPERSCDFFTVDTVLLRTLYVLVLLEIGSRRILYANCTAHPNAAWVTQQARNLSWEMNQLEAPIKLAIHDRDAKFVDEFDDVLRAEGAKVTLTPFRCPKANAHCERMIKTLCATRRWTGCSSSASATLRSVLRQYVDHYNRQRLHLALDLHPPQPATAVGSGPVLREQRLYGLINEYRRAA